MGEGALFQFRAHADTVLGTERDSRKDEAVVFIFIGATVGLLVWAAGKPWIDRWIEVSWYLFLS